MCTVPTLECDLMEYEPFAVLSVNFWYMCFLLCCVLTYGMFTVCCVECELMVCVLFAVLCLTVWYVYCSLCCVKLWYVYFSL